MQTRVVAYGLNTLDDAIQQFGPGFAARLFGPATLRAAAVIRRRAKTRSFGFTDRTGRLRKSIRSRNIAALYEGIRYRRGRAAAFAGGPGARQAFLVERGHGGPRPARPHPYMTRALLETQGAQLAAFNRRASALFPRLVTRYRARRGAGGVVLAGRGRQTVFARTVARRHRRR